jgi:cysteine desulfurase
MERTYLDWAATAPLSRETADYLRDLSLDAFGNPSSIHSWGERAKRLLEDSRKTCAELIGCDPGRICFTSGGSESNNIAISSFLNRKKPGHAVMSAIEHSSLHEPGKMLERFGWKVSRIGMGKSGVIDAEKVLKELRKDTALVAVMLVNNETGSIQPVREIVEAVRSRRTEGPRIHVHTDAVQAFGKIPVNIDNLGVDSASLSAHKFQGPRGVGLLVTRGKMEPIFTGGGQEGGNRPGTENVPGIAAMTLALRRATERLPENIARAEKLCRILIGGLCGCGQCLVLPSLRTADSAGYSPFIISLSFPPIPGEVLVRIMNDKGFGISTGSACSSRKKRDTRVLEGVGISRDIAFSSLRVSTGPDTTEEDMRNFLSALLDEVELLFKVAR